MAAGTAAALVPIRSITRRVKMSSPQSLASSTATQEHARVSFNKEAEEETVTYLPDNQEDAGDLCLKLLSQLKGIQLGKIEDKLGWRFAVTEEDGKKAEGAEKARSNEGQGKEAQTVDQMD